MLRKTQIIGVKELWINDTPSTNSHLQHLSQEEKLTEGFVLRAGSQSDGRGQFSNRWFSNPNENVLMSVLLKPDFLDAEKVFRLNIAIALAVRDAVDHYFPGQVKIKWSKA